MLTATGVKRKENPFNSTQNGPKKNLKVERGSNSLERGRTAEVERGEGA